MTENEKICTWFPAFAAGDLDQKQRERFMIHLANCPECHQSWASMSPLLVDYRRSIQTPVPADGWSRLRTAMGASSIAHPKPILRYATAAILALFLFSGGYWLGQFHAKSEGSLPPEPQSRKIDRRILPQKPKLSFTIARAESIPVTLSERGIMGH